MAKRIAWVLLVVILLCTTLFFLDRNVMLVREVEVTGCVMLDPDLIESHSGVRAGQSLLQLRGKIVRKNIESIPYIDGARMKWTLGGKVTLTVTERAPVGFVEFGVQCVMLDAACTVLEVRPEFEGLELPVVNGLIFLSAQPGKRLTLPEYKSIKDKVQQKEMRDRAILLRAVASRSLDALLQADAVALIREIDVSAPEELRMVTRDGITVYFGPALELEEKAARMVELLEKVHAAGHHAGLLDLGLVEFPSFTPTDAAAD